MSDKEIIQAYKNKADEISHRTMIWILVDRMGIEDDKERRKMFKYIANVSERQFLHDSPVVRNHLIGLLAEDLAQTTGVNHKKVVICGQYEQN